MANSRSMTRNQNHDDESSGKTIKICDDWSDLTHDVLLLVMMQLGVVDFLAFSGVCKSWYSLALCNRNKFIVSSPPMAISIPTDANKKEYCLEDFKGRKFKTIIPHSAGRTCTGVTCGYLVLLGKKSNDFWLVNLMTRHELHFPDVPVEAFCCPGNVRAILVFSPSICGWVFVVLNLCSGKIWFSTVGKREWTKVPTRFFIHDLHGFKGKIYILNSIYPADQARLCEMRLYPEPKLVLLKTERFPKPDFILPGFLSCGENLYVIERISEHPYEIREIDFGEMKWVSFSHENAGEKYAFLFSNLKYDVAVIRPESWDDLCLRYWRCDKNGKGWVFCASLWYFFHDCFDVNLMH